MFEIELIWNREFHWSRYGKPFRDIKSAIAFANKLRNDGDGERVKDIRILNPDGDTVWEFGELANPIIDPPEGEWKIAKVDSVRLAYQCLECGNVDRVGADDLSEIEHPMCSDCDLKMCFGHVEVKMNT